MLLFDVLRLHVPEVTPASSKLHLATRNGPENPLDVFFAGGFEAWQSWQSKRNFEHDHIVSLIKLSDRDRWLFAGCYRRLGLSWVEQPEPAHWSYETVEIDEARVLSGRVVVDYHRSGRNSVRSADGVASQLEVGEVLRERMSVGDFPGYRHVRIGKATLDLLVARGVRSWQAALAAVAGVYLITDTHTGRLYVGSATGEGGIWARWCQYSATGHGGNRDLANVLKGKGADHARHFQYAVLEIADTHASSEEVVERESHWKRVLGSREHGYNAN